jgi:hypothetical protein
LPASSNAGREGTNIAAIAKIISIAKGAICLAVDLLINCNFYIKKNNNVYVMVSKIQKNLILLKKYSIYYYL